MLYHLIQLNSNKDITLHVSANNPAMVRYDTSAFWAHLFTRSMAIAPIQRSRPKNLWPASTKTTSILNHVHQKMLFDFDYVDDLHFGAGCGMREDRPLACKDCVLRLHHTGTRKLFSRSSLGQFHSVLL